MPLPISLPLPFDPDRIDQRDGALIAKLSRKLGPLLQRYHRASFQGMEHIPNGAALFVGNHSGALLSIDTFIWCAKICNELGVEHVPYGLAHDAPLEIPPLNRMLMPLGAVRASHDNAADLFASGKKALVYPGGDVDSLRPWRERNRVKFDGRTGFIRLAMRHRVPIIPIVAHGAQSTFLLIHDNPGIARMIRANDWLRISRWPLAISFPWGLTLGPSPPYIPFPTRIQLSFLEPITLDWSRDSDRDYQADVARRLRFRMESELERLALTSRW